MNRPSGSSDEGEGRPPLPDIMLSESDRERLLDTLTAAFRDQAQANTLLNRIGFPHSQRRTFTNPSEFWSEIFVDLELGIVATPYRRLLTQAIRVYGNNGHLTNLARQYGIDPAAGASGAAARPSGTDPGPPPLHTDTRPEAESCHVIVRADTEDDRTAAEAFLARLGLRPREVWSTSLAVSFQVDSDRAEDVRRGLGSAPFGWTVVAPGRPDYLYGQLFVEGPDGRQFRLVDAPAQQTNRDVAAEVVEQYGSGFGDAVRPTVIDHVQPGGQGRRLDPDDTLHDSGVQDGDRLRVGFETTAGAVNPVDRQDALYRVRNQIVAYAEGHPGIVVSADSALLPTEFEVEFEQLSFGPPTEPGGEPPHIRQHTVLVQLGPDFPETAPSVYWLTPVFHPNVFPNYECEQSRENPAGKGLVCLGLLSESYQPSLDFGDLCQMLVDMAGFRNYGLFEPTGELGPDGRARLRGNFYDLAAAEWVAHNQHRIKAIHGSVATPVRHDAPRYPNVIEPVDGRDGTW